MVTGILLILCGMLAAASFLIAREPGVRGTIDRIAPYGEIIGVIGMVWGIYHLFFLLRAFRFLDLSATGVLIVLGFLLGYGAIVRQMHPSGAPAAKAAIARQRLIQAQVPLGLVGLVLGVLSLLRSLQNWG